MLRLLITVVLVSCAMIPIHDRMVCRMSPDLDEDLIRASIYVRFQLEGGTWSEPELIESVVVENPIAGQDVVFGVEAYTYAANVRHQFAVRLEDGWLDGEEFRPVNASGFSPWSLSYGTDMIAPAAPDAPRSAGD